MPYDAHGNIQVANHSAQNRQLLKILFAEDRGIGLDKMEQFRNDGADTGEMAGTRSSAHCRCERRFVYHNGCIGRIHF
jgi:hypothetical protein